MAHTSADAASLSPWWRHSVILVMIRRLLGSIPLFTVIDLHERSTDSRAGPWMQRALWCSPGPTILMGQEVFLKYGPYGARGTLMWGP